VNDNRVERFRQALGVPMLRFLGVNAIDESDPSAGLWFLVETQALNAANVLHGGTMATVLDLAAYLALLPELGEDEEATTHTFSASYLAGATAGERVEAHAEAHASVLRRGRHIAFVTSELGTVSKPLATALVTKSIRRRSPT
jgi:uncharacterized protein (TIGR00369 family)